MFETLFCKAGQSLPSFVLASWFLNTNRDHEELYHEEYDTVAVMFASLTEYALWDDDNVDGANELSSIRLLNQIICDFDKVNSGHDIIILKHSFCLEAAEPKGKRELCPPP
jgi:hypothetical protein